MADASMGPQVPKTVPELTLHHLSSSQSHRILWALEELKLPCTLKNYRRKRGSAPELTSVFPLGNAPILEVNDPNILTYPKPGIITECTRIFQYLADHHAQGAWTPKTPQDQVRNTYWIAFSETTLASNVDQIMLFDIMPPNAPWFVRPLIKGFCNVVANIRKPPLEKRFALMEDALSEDQPWFAGRELGLADLCVSWPMDMASQRGYLDAAKYPKVAAWVKRVHGRPAYQAALKKGLSYNLVTFDM